MVLFVDMSHVVFFGRQHFFFGGGGVVCYSTVFVPGLDELTFSRVAGRTSLALRMQLQRATRMNLPTLHQNCSKLALGGMVLSLFFSTF